MSIFKVFPIPEEVTRRIRETRIDDLGHTLSISIATENDTGPCRSCLTVFVPGEGRLLFSYAPNECDHPYNEIGPIYIHERDWPGDHHIGSATGLIVWERKSRD